MKKIILILVFLAAKDLVSQEKLFDYSEQAPKTFEALDTPRRDISIIVSTEGFYPKTLAAHAGEELRFFITATTDAPLCFFLKEKNIFKAAQKGKITEASFIFEGPGVYEITCPHFQERAKLTILPSKDARGAGRMPASEKKNVWMPRDE